MRVLIKDAITSSGRYQVIGEAANGEEGIDLAFELQPDIITLDNILPDMIGIDMLEVFVKEQLKSKIFMISAVGQNDLIGRALKLGASNYIVKPFTAEQLIQCIDKHFK